MHHSRITRKLNLRSLSPSRRSRRGSRKVVRKSSRKVAPKKIVSRRSRRGSRKIVSRRSRRSRKVVSRRSRKTSQNKSKNKKIKGGKLNWFQKLFATDKTKRFVENLDNLKQEGYLNKFLEMISESDMETDKKQNLINLINSKPTTSDKLVLIFVFFSKIKDDDELK
jgi:hypothetical protein